jgi:hypothetical protein
LLFIFSQKASIDYYKEQKQLHELNKVLRSETEYLAENTTDSWYENFIKWANLNNPQYVHNKSKYITSKYFIVAMDEIFESKFLVLFPQFQTLYKDCSSSKAISFNECRIIEVSWIVQFWCDADECPKYRILHESLYSRFNCSA